MVADNDFYAQLSGFAGKDNNQRFAYASSLIERVTGLQAVVQPIRDSAASNLVLRKKGEQDNTIIVGAHYDRATFRRNQLWVDGRHTGYGQDSEGSDGIVDNAASIVAILNSVNPLMSMQTRYSYDFVFFGAEEQLYRGDAGRRGSTHYATSASNTMVAMVNLDPLGVGTNVVMTSLSDDALARLALQTASEAGVNLGRWDARFNSDHTSFASLGVPILYLEADQACEGVEHTVRDNMDTVNVMLIWEMAQLLPAVLSRIDSSYRL